MSMQYTRIQYAADRRIARITLNRPEKRNALDDVMVQELTAAVAAAGRDPSVKALRLDANGPAFCAGADLEYLQKLSTFDHEENLADSRRLSQLFRTLYELRKPTVAVVDGPALAGGCGLAAVADFVVCSEERALFGCPEVRIGFIPAIVAIVLVKRLGEGRARELVVRGHTVNARDALAIGLATTVVPSAELEPTARQLLDELLTQNSAQAMGLCKELMSRLQGMNPADALDYAANMNAAARMTPDCKQGVGAFLGKRKVEW
jgi:methylglutaconyl-CoA hydratase